REIDYGEFTGKLSNEFKQNPEKFIEKPFQKGESYKDVEQRIANFLEFLGKNYSGKTVAIVAHQAPQLSLEVLTNGKTWKQAIAEDWRNTKSWQPFWEYLVVE
ncbi:MAG: histidine phosphatase family protein, partial [Candidatus Diapherotrites archaeon]|nr:histidine phosphatase family protein [Candidatus Diapherotrites archaeon]